MLGDDATRVHLYHQLAACERSGLPFASGASTIVSRGGGPARLLEPVLAHLDAGEDVQGAFARADGFSRFEVEAVRAAAKAGTLPETFEQLAKVFEERLALKRKLAGSLCYPLALLHAAVFLPSLPTWFKSGTSAYLLETVVPLLGVYAACIGAAFTFRALRRASPLAVDRLVLAIPGLGSVARKRSLALGIKALGVLYSNGISIIDALDAAAQVSPNVAVGAAFTRVRASVEQGLDVPDAFALEARLFPPLVLDCIATGARSGQLDTMLARSADELDRSARETQMMLVVLAGVGAFLMVAGLVAYKVISFWADFYGQLGRF